MTGSVDAILRKPVILAFLLGILALAAGPARAETAAQAVQRYMAATSVGCWDFSTQRKRRCPLSQDGFVAGQGQGTFPGENRTVLVAVIAYPNESGGNSYEQFAAVFVEAGGRFEFVRRIENVYGTNFRNFGFFSGGLLQMTATVQTASDPRCCPTGTAILTFDIGPLPTAASAGSPPSARTPPYDPGATWRYGYHPRLGLSAHVEVAGEAYGLSCLSAPPGSIGVAAERMTPGLVPWTEAYRAAVFVDPFRIAGGGAVDPPAPSGLLEKVGGFCGLQMEGLMRSRAMIMMPTRAVSLTVEGGPSGTMTVEQGARTTSIRSQGDLSAIGDYVVVPLAGARAAISRLMRACPGIARTMDEDCTGGD